MVRSSGTVVDGRENDSSGRTRATGRDDDAGSGTGAARTSATAQRPGRILVTIQHPAHVHFFRPIIRELEARGNEVRVCAREKDVAIPLLEAHGIEHEVLAGSRPTTLGRAYVQAVYEAKLLQVAREFDPDVITAIGGVAAAHVASVTGASSVVMNDSEQATLINKLVFPFADVVCTPRWYDGSIDGKQVRYDGFHELAYLHPDRFTPDPAPLTAAGVDPEDTYSVVRLVSWDAQHDVGESGFSREALAALAETLSDHGDVYVSAEGDFPDLDGIEPIPVDAADVHHLLAFADCYVGDSGTMATEAGLLGTPAVRYRPFEQELLGNFQELDEAGLVESTPDEWRAIEMVDEYLRDDDAKQTWKARLEEYREDKIDVTAFVADLLTEVIERGSAVTNGPTDPERPPIGVGRARNG